MDCTCAVPDVPGLQTHGSAAQREAVGPFSTAPSPGLQQLLRVVVSDVENKERLSWMMKTSGLRL